MGGQKGVVLFYEALKAHHDVFMAVSTDNWEPIEAGYEVQKLLYPNAKMLYNIKALPSLVRWIQKEKIDIIIAEHSYTGWLGWLLQQWTGKPFIIHSHNIETDRFRQMKKKGWQLYQPYEKWIHHKAAHVFFISDDDKKRGIEAFAVDEKKCSTLTYGIADFKKIDNAKALLKDRFRITSEYVLHFNGTMDYEPNIEAVEAIINHIDPLLEATPLDYTILITGKRLSEHLQNKIKKSKHIRYLDFVPEIDLVYQGSDVFINPVMHNSGIKTKLVEALAHHCTVVSTYSGAAGIPLATAGNKMLLVVDNNWQSFAKSIAQAVMIKDQTPSLFFETFSWTNIARLAADQINKVIQHAKT